MAMKPRCPKVVGFILERPVAIVFALDAKTDRSDCLSPQHLIGFFLASVPAVPDLRSLRGVSPATRISLASRAVTRLLSSARTRPPVKRFSSEARTLQWIDRWV